MFTELNQLKKDIEESKAYRPKDINDTRSQKSPIHQGDMVTNHLATKTQEVPLLDTTLTEREYFRCTWEEVEDIEALKTDLRRQHGIKTSKQEIERLAVREFIDDYRKHAAKSTAVRKLGNPSPEGE